MFKVASWNVNSLNVRLPHVLTWLEHAAPDVLALQETKLTDDKFPVAAIEDAGYQVVYSGQPTYNGVAILAKQALHDVVTDLPDLDDPQRRILAATVNDIRIINLYVPNGQALDSDKFTYKLDWLAKVQAYIESQLELFDDVIVLGDFNIAPDDRDVYDPEKWHEQIHCSQPERQALQALLDCGLVDSFRLFEQLPGTYSWWDYRQGAFRYNHGLRIDHILLSYSLMARCRSSDIDTEPRRAEKPSDHAPVFVNISD